MISSDPLADVLNVLGAKSVRRTRLEASGHWALAFPPQARLKFVALLRGACWILVPRHPPQPLAAGDVFLIGDIAYAVASDPEVVPADGMALYNEPRRDVVRLGGDDTVMLGGEGLRSTMRGQASCLKVCLASCALMEHPPQPVPSVGCWTCLRRRSVIPVLARRLSR
jgi:hypothetical protein